MSEPMNPRTLVAETLKIDISDVSPDAGFVAVEDWDSLADIDGILRAVG